MALRDEAVSFFGHSIWPLGSKIGHEYNVNRLDEGYDLYALFCFEDIPVEMIEDILDGSAADMSDEYFYWLADDYSTLPQSKGDGPGGTIPPLSRTWISPFLGWTIEAALEYVRHAPGTLLNRKHIVVLEKDFYQKKGMMMLYRLEGPEPDYPEESDVKPGDITVTAGTALGTILGLIGYDRGVGAWADSVRYWESEGTPFDI